MSLTGVCGCVIVLLPSLSEKQTRNKILVTEQNLLRHL